MSLSRGAHRNLWCAIGATAIISFAWARPGWGYQVVREADPEAPIAAPAEGTPAAEPTKAEPVVEPADEAGEPKPEAKPDEGKPAEEATRPKTDEKKKPAGATYTVTKEPFKVEVSLDGVFEAIQTSEIVLRPETWSEFVVESAVEAGTLVKKGDVLLKFDPRNIDWAIRDMENDRELSYLAIKQAEDELKHLEQESPLELEVAEQSARLITQELKNWENIDRAYYEKSNDYQLRYAKQYVENAEEELKQLDKMYAADDLTEETEEIILKRQREQVDQARFYFERAKIEHARTIEQEIPRQDESIRLGARLAEIKLARIQSRTPMELGRKKLELAKLRYEQSKTDERYAKLQHDRGLMEIYAPEDGVVYYGRPIRGEWSGSSGMAEQIRRGGNVSAQQALMTIVVPRPMFVRAKLPEKELAQVAIGQQGRAVPTGFPDTKLVAAVSRISPIPVSEGHFDARVTVDLGPGHEALMPGMQCSVKLVPYRQAEAIAVPSKALFTDDLDDANRYVLVVGKDGEHARRDVTVGKVSGDRTEIVGGLAAGEKILLEKPEPAKGE
ncbi:MAG: HlyD family efflux transporter periplasmic adaptor subunit [Pirellulales bacterium]|nr:HlyD family efflux transporter periplasmic adaptor subunit [Pirellulales bacterium]